MAPEKEPDESADETAIDDQQLKSVAGGIAPSGIIGEVDTTYTSPTFFPPG